MSMRGICRTRQLWFNTTTSSIIYSVLYNSIALILDYMPMCNDKRRGREERKLTGGWQKQKAMCGFRQLMTSIISWRIDLRLAASFHTGHSLVIAVPPRARDMSSAAGERGSFTLRVGPGRIPTHARLNLGDLHLEDTDDDDDVSSAAAGSPAHSREDLLSQCPTVEVKAAPLPALPRPTPWPAPVATLTTSGVCRDDTRRACVLTPRAC